MKKTKLVGKSTPAALGPYSPGLKSGNLIFTTQAGLTTDGKLPEDIRGQADQCLKNIKEILEAGGASMSDIVKATILLTDINDFTQVNHVYKDFFSEPYPARATMQVAALPAGLKILIDVIADVG